MNHEPITHNQAGFSPLAILILAALGVFILWELTLITQRKFVSGTTSASPTPAAANCNFPDPNDPCDLDSGAGFDL